MLSRSMSFAEAFPDDVLREIRSYPGNDRCCDCRSLDTDWCSISHGILICLECAGKHRSLGVQVSFVRSISMDSWSKQQVEMVRQGGNEQIKRFFRKLEMENLPVQQLYCSKGANHYRERLKERVTKILAGEIQAEPRNIRSSRHQARRNAKSQSAIPDLMGRSDSNGNSHQNQQPSVQVFNVSFGDGPMGMTISKDFGGRALVSKLVSGGVAEANGVQVGDHLSGVAKKRMDSYDEIMHMIPCMKRPLTIQFTRTVVAHHGQHAHPHVSPRALGHHGAPEAGAGPVTASPGKNRSMHGSKSLANLSLNLHSVSAEKAIVNGYHKPKIRSPRSNSNGWEPSRDQPAEEAGEDASGQFRSPSGLTKLRSVRSRSKDSVDGTDWREALGVTLPADEPAPSLTLNGTESTLTDERHTPATVSSPVPCATSSNGHPAADAPSQVPSQSETPSLALSTSNDDSYCHSAASELSPFHRTLSVQSEPILSKTDIYREIDQLLDDKGAKLSPLGVVRGVSMGSANFLGEEGSPMGKDLDQHKHVLMGTEGSSKKLTLQVGTPLKVLRNDRWRSASMRRMHRDGSFKVVYRDGSSEARVNVDRIALTVDTVRALADWQDCTAALEAEMTNSSSLTQSSGHISGRGNKNGQLPRASCGREQENQSDERIAAAFRAASMDDSTAYSHTYSDASDALSSPDTSSYRLLGHPSQSQSQALQVHSFRADDLRSAESFVVEAGEDLNKWIESEAVECVVETGRDRLSSVDSVLSAGGAEGVGSFYSPREEFEILEAVYDQAPLGLRISSSRGSAGSSKSTSPAPQLSLGVSGAPPMGEREVRPPDVTKVVVGGRSDLQGIRVGDELVSIDGRQVLDYYDAMAVLQSASYPLRLQFRRKNTSLGAAVAKSSMVLMNTLLDKMGLQRPSLPLAQSPPLSKRTASRRLSVPVLPPNILITSPEPSPHRAASAARTTESSSVSAADSQQVSPSQVSPFPLLNRKGSKGFPTPVGADGELQDVELG